MRSVSALALRDGQVFSIPGIEDKFKCLYLSEFQANIESLSDGTKHGLSWEAVVDVYDEADLLTPLASETLVVEALPLSSPESTAAPNMAPPNIAPLPTPDPGPFMPVAA